MLIIEETKNTNDVKFYTVDEFLLLNISGKNNFQKLQSLKALIDERYVQDLQKTYSLYTPD